MAQAIIEVSQKKESLLWKTSKDH